MKIFKKIFMSFILLLTVIVGGYTTLCIMYSNGVFGVCDVEEVNKNICVSIKLTEKNLQNEDSEILYGSGFFIAPNSVVCTNAHLPAGYNVEIKDMNGNEYQIIDKKVYDNITFLKTDKSNKSIKYLYSVAKKNDIINVHITSDNNINNLSKCRIVDNNFITDSSKNILCEGQIEGKSSHPVIDEYGRIAGITWANDAEGKYFFAYTICEILKNDIALLFGFES